VTTPEIIEPNREKILGERWISPNRQITCLGERVGSIIHEDLDKWNLSAKWIPKCLNGEHKHQPSQSSEQISDFFWANPNDFLSRLFTVDKIWLNRYRRRTIKLQIGGIAALPGQNIPKA